MQRLVSKRAMGLANKRREKLRADLLARFGISSIDTVDRLIAQYAEPLFARESYLSVLAKLSDCVAHPENEPSAGAGPQRTPCIANALAGPPAVSSSLQPQLQSQPERPGPEPDQEPRGEVPEERAPPAPEAEQRNENFARQPQDEWSAVVREKDRMDLAQVEREMALEAEKKRLYRFVPHIDSNKDREELDAQYRLNTMRKQRERQRERENDRDVLAKQNAAVQDEFRQELEQKTAATKYQQYSFCMLIAANRYCVSSSLHEKLRYVEKQKEDSEKEKRNLHAEYERTLKEAQNFEKSRTEQRMHIASTLRAVYEQQEQVRPFYASWMR